jgi:hypothetical protein
MILTLVNFMDNSKGDEWVQWSSKKDSHVGGRWTLRITHEKNEWVQWDSNVSITLWTTFTFLCMWVWIKFLFYYYFYYLFLFLFWVLWFWNFEIFLIKNYQFFKKFTLLIGCNQYQSGMIPEVIWGLYLPYTGQNQPLDLIPVVDRYES